MADTPHSAPAEPAPPTPGWLPADHAQRTELHEEVHARPSARIRLPALVIYLAVDNSGVSREAECEHLRRLPEQSGLSVAQLQGNFLRLRLPGYTLKWERHSEFTRYSLVQPLPQEAMLGARDPQLLAAFPLPAGWLASVPGRTLAAIKMAMVHGELDEPQRALDQARDWFAGHPLVASLMGMTSQSMVATDLVLRDSGFVRMLVVAAPQTTETRAGRISQRLLELETYRLLALRGLPMAKTLGPELADAERELADVTAALEGKQASDQELLDRLVSLAARIERATAQHDYRIGATRAYYALVNQRITEIRERPIPGTQTLGEFLQRRLNPAMATVNATAQRLASLAERVSRASALLRTRVDIATEEQNQQLLAKLTRGQELQLRLQTTVEGLSIAAISYYVISLLFYAAKALKAAHLPLDPEIAVGACIPLVLWAVWRTTRRIHRRLYKAD